MVESEVIEALRRLEQTVAEGASYEAAMAALHACTNMPGADAAAQAIGEWKVTLALHYERSTEACESAMLEFLALEVSLLDRASKVLAVCATHPTLAERYLPSLIAELEVGPHDTSVTRLLAAARQVRGSP